MSDKKTYRLTHITDIYAVPFEHWLEMWEDLRQSHSALTLGRISMKIAEGKERPLCEVCPHIDFTPDGLRATRVVVTTKGEVTE